MAQLWFVLPRPGSQDEQPGRVSGYEARCGVSGVDNRLRQLGYTQACVFITHSRVVTNSDSSATHKHVCITHSREWITEEICVLKEKRP